MVVRVIVHKVSGISQNKMIDTHCYNKTADNNQSGILDTYNLS